MCIYNNIHKNYELCIGKGLERKMLLLHCFLLLPKRKRGCFGKALDGSSTVNTVQWLRAHLRF